MTDPRYPLGVEPDDEQWRRYRVELARLPRLRGDTLPDAPVVDLCACERFELWYVDEDDGGIWCVCAHGPDEHIGCVGVCIGEVKIL